MASSPLRAHRGARSQPPRLVSCASTASCLRARSASTPWPLRPCRLIGAPGRRLRDLSVPPPRPCALVLARQVPHGLFALAGSSGRPVVASATCQFRLHGLAPSCSLGKYPMASSPLPAHRGARSSPPRPVSSASTALCPRARSASAPWPLRPCRLIGAPGRRLRDLSVPPPRPCALVLARQVPHGLFALAGSSGRPVVASATCQFRLHGLVPSCSLGKYPMASSPLPAHRGARSSPPRPVSSASTALCLRARSASAPWPLRPCRLIGAPGRRLRDLSVPPPRPCAFVLAQQVPHGLFALAGSSGRPARRLRDLSVTPPRP